MPGGGDWSLHGRPRTCWPSAAYRPRAQRLSRPSPTTTTRSCKVRPTNVASIPVLEQGGVAKPELIKAKTVNKADLLLGAPKDGIGKVGFFDPVLPSTEILEVMRADERQQLLDRFAQRREEFRHYREEYRKLEAEGLIRVKDGIVQIADPTTAASPDAPHGEFKDIGGDHDLYEITDRHGNPLPEAGRRLVVEHLRSLGVNVNHPDHVSWKADSPTTHDPQADAAIRAKHETDEPLVAFIPKSTPREVFAGDQVSGPERTPGPADPHRPAAGASYYEPKPGDPGYEPSRPGGGDGTGGSGHDGSGPGGPGGGRGCPTEATSSRRGGGDQRQRHRIRQGGSPREGRGAVSVRGPEQQPRPEPAGPGPDGGSVRPGGSPGSRQRRRHQGRPANRRERRGCEATQPGPERSTARSRAA